ncbi:hypothetical protein [Hydrogenimonas sp.]
MKRLDCLAGNPWLFWGLLALSFLLPPLFILFLALAVAKGWRWMAEEYGDVARYWHEAAQKAYERGERAVERASKPRSAPLPRIA